MANDLQLPQPNINPGVVGGSSGFAPNAIDMFMSSFLDARKQKSSESAQARQDAIAQGHLDLAREQLKLQQEQEKTKQASTDAQGGGLQQLIKAISPVIEQQSQYTPQGQNPPILSTLGIPSQNAQQGGQQPAQAPNPAQGAPSARQDPMQVFSGIVSHLPASAVPDFVKNFSGIAQQAQAKKDQGRALDEADRLTRGILTPDQANQLKTARLLAESGAPEKLWQAMLPSAQIDLAKAAEEVRSMKNKREADKAATVQLTKLGLAPKAPVGMDEFVVDGAAKIFADYISGVRKDARAAALERAKTDRETAIKGLEGSALEIAAMNPDWTPQQIKHALVSSPAYAGLPAGEISKAAFEAPKKAQLLTAPANETVAKARVVYGPGRAALATVNAMDAKGEALGVAARAAQVTEGEAGKVGLGIGGAGGMAVGGPIGAAIGAAGAGAAGLVAAPLIRTGGRLSMSPDQQRLWTAAQSLAATIYRPESGAAVTQEEVRQTLERYIPLATDKPGTRAFKRALRGELDKTLANISGLPPQLGKNVIDALLTKQEQSLTDGTSW